MEKMEQVIPSASLLCRFAVAASSSSAPFFSFLLFFILRLRRRSSKKKQHQQVLLSVPSSLPCCCSFLHVLPSSNSSSLFPSPPSHFVYLLLSLLQLADMNPHEILLPRIVGSVVRWSGSVRSGPFLLCFAALHRVL